MHPKQTKLRNRGLKTRSRPGLPGAADEEPASETMRNGDPEPAVNRGRVERVAARRFGW